MRLHALFVRSPVRVFAIALLSAAALLSMAGASAQIRPAYTKDVDARGRVPYNVNVEFTRSSCSFNCTNFITSTTAPGVRVLLFDAPAVPAGKRLIIESVSAEVPSNNAVNSISFQSLPILSNQRAKWQYHGPFFNTVSGGTGLSGMSAVAFVTYEPGESPHIRVRVGDSSTFFASISIGGYLIDAIN